jgi:two-component system sensor histidine kinase TctE
VRVAVREHQDGVLLEVSDSGPGVAAAERDKVVTPFYRASSTMESNPAGTGLGLAIVRDIVSLHGARMHLSDADGGTGLKVSVIFPSGIVE